MKGRRWKDRSTDLSCRKRDKQCDHREQPIGPFALKDPTMPETPREMTVEEIHELVEQFGDCARRAKEAGFDAVEVHGAHGYLIGAFASPFSNKRSDEYEERSETVQDLQ